ncbi:hypothetical protein [Kitasatospora sp. NPDC093102]|uniref:hypothetical protein n=1 Tax=Kitasatospora sp. NPDC093102 TaxID=3155069 RepID=UPI003433BF6F
MLVRQIPFSRQLAGVVMIGVWFSLGFGVVVHRLGVVCCGWWRAVSGWGVVKGWGRDGGEAFRRIAVKS